MTVNVNDPTGDRLVGRVVTGVFMPKRPDLDKYVPESAKKENRAGRGGQNAGSSTPSNSAT